MFRPSLPPVSCTTTSTRAPARVGGLVGPERPLATRTPAPGPWRAGLEHVQSRRRVREHGVQKSWNSGEVRTSAAASLARLDRRHARRTPVAERVPMKCPPRELRRAAGARCALAQASFVARRRAEEACEAGPRLSSASPSVASAASAVVTRAIQRAGVDPGPPAVPAPDRGRAEEGPGPSRSQTWRRSPGCDPRARDRQRGDGHELDRTGDARAARRGEKKSSRRAGSRSVRPMSHSARAACRPAPSSSAGAGATKASSSTRRATWRTHGCSARVRASSLAETARRGRGVFVPRRRGPRGAEHRRGAPIRAPARERPRGLRARRPRRSSRGRARTAPGSRAKFSFEVAASIRVAVQPAQHGRVARDRRAASARKSPEPLDAEELVLRVHQAQRRRPCRSRSRRGRATRGVMRSRSGAPPSRIRAIHQAWQELELARREQRARSRRAAPGAPSVREETRERRLESLRQARVESPPAVAPKPSAARRGAGRRRGPTRPAPRCSSRRRTRSPRTSAAARGAAQSRARARPDGPRATDLEARPSKDGERAAAGRRSPARPRRVERRPRDIFCGDERLEVARRRACSQRRARRARASLRPPARARRRRLASSRTSCDAQRTRAVPSTRWRPTTASAGLEVVASRRRLARTQARRSAPS